jgi:hypothetical protein
MFLANGAVDLGLLRHLEVCLRIYKPSILAHFNPEQAQIQIFKSYDEVSHDVCERKRRR